MFQPEKAFFKTLLEHVSLTIGSLFMNFGTLQKRVCYFDNYIFTGVATVDMVFNGKILE